MRRLFIKLISLYQRILSPDHGLFKKPFGHCRYYPSCSEYAKRAIQKHGAIKGVFLAIYRVIRCNPWSKGGIDEL